MRSPVWRVVACCLQVVALVAAVGGAQETVRFTVTADARSYHAEYDALMAAMNTLVGGQGDFQVSPGDMDGRLWDNRAVVDWYAGASAMWIPGVGNHEAEDPVEMEWIRSEFTSGNGERAPLQNLVTRVGPDGSWETTFSWDLGNAHFVYLNQYWDGTDDAGSDVATDGDVVPELLAWLADDLEANIRPAVFVFGHEPAFPFHRHLGESLDAHSTNRDAFWALLEEESVVAYICGHTHVFSTYRPAGGRVWQIDVGNAGNDSSFLDGQTFLSVVVDTAQVRIEVCRNFDGSFSCDSSWIVPIPIVLKDGFESGDFAVWSSAFP